MWHFLTRHRVVHIAGNAPNCCITGDIHTVFRRNVLATLSFRHEIGEMKKKLIHLRYERNNHSFNCLENEVTDFQPMWGSVVLV
jgi:hypothetical protein